MAITLATDNPDTQAPIIAAEPTGDVRRPSFVCLRSGSTSPEILTHADEGQMLTAVQRQVVDGGQKWIAVYTLTHVVTLQTSAAVQHIPTSPAKEV